MAVERTNRDIRTLIAQISAGEIMLPEIQRGYVWKATQVAKLIESLYRGYPAGSLLLWKTEQPAETRTAAIGAEQGLSGTIPMYLLDGQQRLTSLHRIFTDHTAAQIVFNVETEEFRSQNNATLRSKKWVKVFDIVGPDADTFSLQTALRSAELAVDGPEIGRRLQALEKIALRDFHMEVLHDFEYEEVTEIFVRVNSGGRALRTADLAMATLSARTPGFLSQLEEEAERWAARGCRGIDVNFLIKAITLSLSISGKRTASVAKLTSVSREAVAEGWQRVQRGLERVVPLLQEILLVPSTALIPSISAVHPLVVFYGRQPEGAEVPRETERGLLYWFMAATFRNRYTGATDSNLTQDVNALDAEDQVRALLANLRIGDTGVAVSARDLAGRNVSSPHLMFSYLATAHAGARDWWAEKAISVPAEGSDMPHYTSLHPAVKLRGHRNKYTTAEIGELANIVFVSEETAKQIIGNRTPAAYMHDVAQSDRIAHAVPDDPSVLEAEGYREFLGARRALLAERINALFEKYRPSFLVSAGGTTPAAEGGRSLAFSGYGAGRYAVLIAAAEVGGQRWAGKIDMEELEGALDAAATGIDNDVTVAGDAAPLRVDEDGAVLAVGPFAVRGTVDQWRAVVKGALGDAKPASQCPDLVAVQWPGEPEEFLLADAGTGSH